MKVVIIFADGVKQINFTPENDDEKQALKLITPNDNIDLAVKYGSFGEEHFKPFGVEFNKCVGGYLRTYSNDESIMLILTPKEENKKENKSKNNPEQIAVDFTEKVLNNVNTLLSEDYKTGFKEGIEKYIEHNLKK